MEFTDQLNRIVDITFPPKRIISLVPSQTELLCYFGLEEKLVGVTKFCVHPVHLRKEKQIIGGTKNLSIEKIKQLKPDLIIANKEENEKEQIEELEKYFPVWVSDVNTFENALIMIDAIGALTQKVGKSIELISNLNKLKSDYINAKPHLKSIYLIWKDPYITVGVDTFISNMMRIAGFENLMFYKKRYPSISLHEIKEMNPDVILLSSEPYPFREKHLEEFKMIFHHQKSFWQMVKCFPGMEAA